MKFQEQVLENVIEHLFDKGALARKAATTCVTTFLSYNAYSANVSIIVYLKYVYSAFFPLNFQNVAVKIV